jgi:hypothetical protein
VWRRTRDASRAEGRSRAGPVPGPAFGVLLRSTRSLPAGVGLPLRRAMQARMFVTAAAAIQREGLPMNKKASSLNALKHGGYSNLGLLPGEDPKEFLKHC